jgi:uncharacterized protein
MYQRLITQELTIWAKKANRKPLVLRGARQVGKTTAVNQFAQQFEQYIYLNLELPEDRQPFEQFANIESLVQALFFIKGKVLSKKDDTLIFIDEIQAAPKALSILRYFYESMPTIAVIAAGSMLESLFNNKISFPVGRVEYKVVRPVSFVEFLGAMHETAALEQLEQVPMQTFTHHKLLQLFHTYALIGGMPEVVQHYCENKDLTALSPIYDSLITSYLEDVEKYASSETQIQHIRYAIRASFGQAGKRIKFEGFGNSPYKSKDMGEALRIIEKALLIQLIYPDTAGVLPFNPDLKKSPRLQVLDTGMMNYFGGIQREILDTKDLLSVHQGTMIEHLVGQELLSSQYLALSSLHFWIREKNSSSAEVDYLYPFESKLIPIEVKSGKTGSLRSLNLLMDLVPHNLSIRFYAGELAITNGVSTEGKSYFLLNMPYYLATQLEKYLQWFSKQIT